MVAETRSICCSAVQFDEEKIDELRKFVGNNYVDITPSYFDDTTNLSHQLAVYVLNTSNGVWQYVETGDYIVKLAGFILVFTEQVFNSIFIAA